MARRIHVAAVAVGEVPVGPAEAHHARDVLRMSDGDAVEVFDDAGNVAAGVLRIRGARDVVVAVERVDEADARGGGVALEWSIAAAVPKGERADWMVEKLSELGTASFVPLAAARSVVLPEGRNKRDRWVRIATEAAKQSRRRGVMRVGELTPLTEAIAAARDDGPAGRGWYLSLEDGAVAVASAVGLLGGPPTVTRLTLFVGPEGGWTAAELSAFAAAGLAPVRLTDTVLRVETAAVAAAAVIGAWGSASRGDRSGPSTVA